MKHISILLISFLTAFSVHAHVSTSAVTITVSGNKNLQLSVDGRSYTLSNGTATGDKTTFAFNNLEMGQHTLLITRVDLNTNRSDRISTTFNLRDGYDMLIKVNGDGSLELIETKKSGISDNQNPMSKAGFNNLLKNVRVQQSTTGRASVIAKAFNNGNNFFTTFQVEQLLQLVNSESHRLRLAKLSYRSITDPANFSDIYDLFNSTASRNELEDYVNSFKEDTATDTTVPDADFTRLYQTIKQQSPVSTQMNSLINAFNNSQNTFTTYQAGQLIQLVNAESNRLQLAKLSYRSITDRLNFSQLYYLISSQAGKDELAAYVNNYNTGGNSGPGMPDANFISLYQTIQQQWPVSTQMNSLTNAFNNTNNIFSVYQASQLIQLVLTEANRLLLAKLSYRSITDPVNFSQIYALVNSQASKDELVAYVNNYTTGGSSNLAMSDANFTSLYKSIQMQFFPGEKMSSLSLSFNHTSNYFTSSQAKQLIQLVSLESNRLQLAKLSYRTITDRNNFNQLYDLLNTQASRNELDAYVKAYKA